MSPTNTRGADEVKDSSNRELQNLHKSAAGPVLVGPGGIPLATGVASLDRYLESLEKTDPKAAEAMRAEFWTQAWTEPPRIAIECLLGAVHLGEALEFLRRLPSDSVDAVITDPPYSSGGLMRSDRAQATGSKYANRIERVSFSGDNRDGRAWHYWCALWISECLRVVKEQGYLLMFCDWRQAPTAADALQAGGFVWRGTVAWNKGEAARAPHKGYFRHQCEYVQWGTRGGRDPLEHAGPFPGCFDVSVLQDDKHHQTGKPTALMRELVKCVPPGGIILDPFAGSGTTLVAAELEGRRAIGFDQEPAYVAVANDRIRAARVSLDVRAAQEGQVPLFGVEASPRSLATLPERPSEAPPAWPEKRDVFAPAGSGDA